MSNGTLASTFIQAAAMASAGLISGLFYFRALRRTVDLLAERQSWLWSEVLTVARIMSAIAVLALMARLGAIALLAGFAGFLSARMLALRAVRRAG